MTRRAVTRATARAAVGTAALALVAGCIPSIGGSDDPSTSQQVGRTQLGEEQLRSALPTDEQTPKGFTVDTATESEPPDPESTTYPAVCEDVRLSGKVADELKEHSTGSAKKDYVGPGGLGVLSVEITTYDEEVPSTLFDKAGEALGQCDTFQIIDKYGPSDWKLSPVSLAPVGDRTYGVRVENTTEGDTFQGGVVQVATASLGHNRVHVVHSAGPASKYHSAAVETLLKTTVDNLESL